MLIDENCSHQKQALNQDDVHELLTHVPEWSFDADLNNLNRTFKLNRYKDGPRFAVEVGKMADQQDHHPDMHIYYKKCVVEFTTHSAGGVSINDFICAAKTDEIFSKFSN